MQKLIEIKINENQEPIISGRMLHEFLEVKTPYTQWFDRMVEYGFIENVDFATVSQKCEIANGGYQNKIDHAVKLDMAKEISMIQRSEKGKIARKYFIEAEKDWNSPEKVMARALKIAEKTIEKLTLTNKNQSKQITELKPKAEYHDNVLNKDGLITSTVIAKDLGLRSAMELHKILCGNKIIFRNQSGIWCPYADYEWLIEENYCDYKSYEDTKATPCLKWTEKGRKWINENFNAWKERCCA